MTAATEGVGCVDREETIRAIKAVTRHYVQTGNIKCHGCGGEGLPVHAFRCYFCGLYFCRKCGAEHFGGQR
jgi:hypothetical protein